MTQTLKINLNNWWAIFELPMLDDSRPLALFEDEAHAGAHIEALNRREMKLSLTPKEYTALKVTHKE